MSLFVAGELDSKTFKGPILLKQFSDSVIFYKVNTGLSVGEVVRVNLDHVEKTKTKF